MDKNAFDDIKAFDHLKALDEIKAFDYIKTVRVKPEVYNCEHDSIVKS